jgi:hypothetical protein
MSRWGNSFCRLAATLVAAQIGCCLLPAQENDDEAAPLREAYLNRLLETCGQVLLSVIDRKTPEKKESRLKLSGVYSDIWFCPTIANAGRATLN